MKSEVYRTVTGLQTGTFEVNVPAEAEPLSVVLETNDMMRFSLYWRVRTDKNLPYETRKIVVIAAGAHIPNDQPYGFLGSIAREVGATLHVFTDLSHQPRR